MKPWSHIERARIACGVRRSSEARRVSEIIAPPVGVTPETPAILAIDIAERNGLRHLVVGGGDAPLGVAALDDLRRADVDATVSACTRWTLVGVGPDTTLCDAADIVHRWQCDFLLVLDDKRLIGVVSREDLGVAELRPFALDNASIGGKSQHQDGSQGTAVIYEEEEGAGAAATAEREGRSSRAAPAGSPARRARIC